MTTPYNGPPEQAALRAAIAHEIRNHSAAIANAGLVLRHTAAAGGLGGRALDVIARQVVLLGELADAIRDGTGPAPLPNSHG
jgi:hypothetical protein